MDFAIAAPPSCHLNCDHLPLSAFASLHNLCPPSASASHRLLVPTKPFSAASQISGSRRQNLFRRPPFSQSLLFCVNVDEAEAVSSDSGTAPSPEEEEDRSNVETILQILELLEKKRDMPYNEARLTIMIEDPREVERRKELGIEDERGCSRDDMAAALKDIHEGRIPSDRLVLRELKKEMLNWPAIEDEVDKQKNRSQSPYAKVTDTGVDPKVASKNANVDWDAAAEFEPGNEYQNLVNVPPAAGFSVVYLVSIIPILIGVAVVSILFFNSFR